MQTYQRYGFDFQVEISFDDTCEPPWMHNDGHGEVREMHDQKRPGERPFKHGWHNKRSSLMYDWQGAIKLAHKDGWNITNERAEKLGIKKLKHRRAQAVEDDFEYLRRWANDVWHWVIIQVTCVQTDVMECIGGVESDADDHIAELVNELIDQVAPLTQFERKVFQAAEKANGCGR